MADDHEEFDPSRKKKKKKKPIGVENGEQPTAAADEQQETASVPAKSAPPPPPPDAEEGDLDFEKKKKKKKKKQVDLAEDAQGEQPDGSSVEDLFYQDIKGFPGTDVADSGASAFPEYTYDELLNRVYEIMKEKNPGFQSGERRKIVMKPPSCMRVGSKKTAFTNFAEICRSLKRQPKHVLQFLLAELGTSGSMDANDQLIVKGRFQQKNFESVLRNYIKEYVSCHTCKAPETLLEKDTRLFFLKCEVCGSRCSVATIKTGFQAMTGKRAAARAAAAAQAGQ